MRTLFPGGPIRVLACLWWVVALPTLAVAQQVVMRGGQVFDYKTARIEGDAISFPVDSGSGSAEVTFLLRDVEALRFPEPKEIIKNARQLVAAGQYEEALAALDPVVKIFVPFKKVKGSYWAECSSVTLECYSALGRLAAFDELLEQFKIFDFEKDSPAAIHLETIRLNHLMRLGKIEEAEVVLNYLTARALTDEQRSIMTLVRGDLLLGKKQYEEALYAFLRLPVFYPNLEHLQPRALGGALKAYTAMQRDSLAAATRAELLELYPDSLEAAQLRAAQQKEKP